MFLCIVGTSRCGTTLLRQMMHDHPDLVVFRETHWIPKMIEFFGTQRVSSESLLSVLEKTSWDSGEDLLSINLAYSQIASRQVALDTLRSELRTSDYLNIQEFSDILVRILFQWEGNWGDTTPDYGFYMKAIQSLWPQCRFVHIIRDGLGTAWSMAGHSGSQLMVSAGYDNWCSLSYDRLYERYATEQQPVEAYVASWRRRLNRIRDESRGLSGGSYLEIRFEDLLQDPRTTLSLVCSFLRLPSSDDWLGHCADIIRPRDPAPQLQRDQLIRLNAEDLLALNECQVGAFHKLLPYSPDTRPQDIEGLSEKAGQMLDSGNAEMAVELAVQMMATLACHQDRSLLARAHELAILASHQSGDDDVKQHWVWSAIAYGLPIPEIEALPS